jgi:hypothetical protein
MRTQSIDTHPDVERVLIALLRQASSQKRFQSVQALTRSGIWASVQTWFHHHPGASLQEAAVHYVASAYGDHLARLLQERLAQQEHWQIQPIDLLAVLEPILCLFASADIPFYLGGSLASSLHGMPQLAQDLDLVLHPRHLSFSSKKLWHETHLAALRERYVIDEEAVQRRASVSLLHLETLLKVDVIVPQREAFDLAMIYHLERHLLDEHHAALPVAGAVEMILWKLARYQMETIRRQDGMEDDAGWNEILGMLKVQGPRLNLSHLEYWAKHLEVDEFLEQALLDAGIRDVPSAH